MTPPRQAVLTLASFATSSSDFSRHSLRLLGMADPPPLWVVGGQIEAGQPLIVLEEASALYIIDNEGRPFQVSGVLDMLNDPVIIKDITSPYLPALRQAERLHQAAFKALGLKELKQHENVLRQWESFSMSSMLTGEVAAENAREFAWLTWSQVLFNGTTNRRVKRALMNAPMPSNTQKRARLDINLDGYPHALLFQD